MNWFSLCGSLRLWIHWWGYKIGRCWLNIEETSYFLVTRVIHNRMGCQGGGQIPIAECPRVDTRHWREAGSWMEDWQRAPQQLCVGLSPCWAGSRCWGYKIWKWLRYFCLPRTLTTRDSAPFELMQAEGRYHSLYFSYVLTKAKHIDMVPDPAGSFWRQQLYLPPVESLAPNKIVRN